MNKHLATLVLAVLMGILGFAVSGVAVAGTADKKPEPPGQGECGHGNTDKECKADPQPDGKDCEAHGNNGGVNEDHCAPQETTPTTPTETTPTTPDVTTPTTPDVTTPTTPDVTTPTQTTPSDTTPQSTTPTQAPEPSSTESPSTPTIVGLPPVAPAAKKQAAAKEQVTAVDAASADAPKPTQQAQQAPLTL